VALPSVFEQIAIDEVLSDREGNVWRGYRKSFLTREIRSAGLRPMAFWRGTSHLAQFGPRSNRQSRPCLRSLSVAIEISPSSMYDCGMLRRTTVEIDNALLHQAQGALGTTGVKDTVEKAFREAIRRHLRDRLAERIEAGTGVDRSPELLAESRPAR
jgi:Arc/MetJ family transcription regulator